jgi:hypothetical protein
LSQTSSTTPYLGNSGAPKTAVPAAHIKPAMGRYFIVVVRLGKLYERKKFPAVDMMPQILMPWQVNLLPLANFLAQ